MFYIGNARTVFQEIPGDGSYNRHVLITGVLISGIHCTYIALCTIKARNNTIRDYDDYMYNWRMILITVNSINRTVDYPNSFEWSLRSPDNRGCPVYY